MFEKQLKKRLGATTKIFDNHKQRIEKLSEELK